MPHLSKAPAVAGAHLFFGHGPVATGSSRLNPRNFLN